MNINERIDALRSVMKAHHVQMILIPTSDFHESEYVADYFKARVFMSGFTGSAGTMIVSEKEAGLWTDGRYFIQAENQLQGSCIKLFKMGEEGVPSVARYIEENLQENECIAFDGRVVNTALGRQIAKTAAKKHGKVLYTRDLIGKIWKNRPPLSKEKAFDLPVKYAGKSAAEKIADLQKQLAEQGCTAMIDSSLDNIAWLLNMRGNDIECNPVVLSFIIVRQDQVTLYIDRKKLNEKLSARFESEGIVIRDYGDIYRDVKQFAKGDRVMLDPTKVNYRITSSIKKSVQLIERSSLIVLSKAIKNPVEIENLKRAHIKDGVAVTKFMYWLKKNIGKIEITELSADEKLTGLRAQQEGFIEKSFETIAGYNANAAMMHYSATETSYAVLKKEGMLLVDSGGQYWEGTTDITRTFACGETTAKMRHDFTLVLKSVLQLSRVKFLYGCSGLTLDILARGPLWDEGIDYKCGTGHGVGYLLNVHEGPQGFRWRAAAGKVESEIFEEGMIITNEPGVYIEGEYGIRTENEMVCRKLEKNEYGQFMGFETITMVPIDLELVDTSLLEKKDIEQLNKYHKEVYEKIAPHLDEEEKEWLKQATRAVA